MMHEFTTGRTFHLSIVSLARVMSLNTTRKEDLMYDIEQSDSSDLFADTEAAESQLNAFIERRAKGAEKANAEEELWRASERRVLAKRRRENRQSWLEYYEHMNRLHLGIAEEHASRRVRLLAEEFSPDEGPDGEAA
jgi:hypothetical protein